LENKRTSIFTTMNMYHLASRDIPLDGSWDVIIAGGGPSGCAAAIAAAREGAATLLIESTGSLGGSGTSALVPAWCPFSDNEKIIYRGIAEKVFSAAKKGMPHVKESDLDWVPIDAERLKRVYDSMVTEAGASILFHTTVASVDCENNGIAAVILANKSGLSAYRAKVYVDCTGDADLCAWSGVAFHKGDDDGDLMPATHCFLLSNVDDYAFRTIYKNGFGLHSSNPESPLYEIVKSGRFPLLPDAHCCCNVVGPGVIGFNAGHIWDVDNTDPSSVSRALIQGRQMAAAFRDALAEYCPEAFGNAFLVSTGSVVGIRETRRIVGDYVLTLDDYLARRTFNDEICRNSYFIDVHHAKAEVEAHINSRQEGIEPTIRYATGESHGIPYRCLIPKGIRNVLVAGRSISCERSVQGSVRVMTVCLAMGEAAGMAAAHAALLPDNDVHAIDVAALRNKLREAGAYLP